ncbi:hypothetical protein SAMN06296386_104263 [Lachnospiraceae bacterium]|nr:hypothetical protein SAMN06296386_104263 [Lachnospiraceae bacterium]
MDEVEIMQSQVDYRQFYMRVILDLYKVQKAGDKNPYLASQIHEYENCYLEANGNMSYLEPFRPTDL